MVGGVRCFGVMLLMIADLLLLLLLCNDDDGDDGDLLFCLVFLHTAV